MSKNRLWMSSVGISATFIAFESLVGNGERILGREYKQI